MSKIGEIDKNLAVPGTIQGENLNFYNVRHDPFAIYGLLPGREGEPFRRLPLEVAEKTSPGVRALHTNTSGGRVRFKTDSSRIAIRAVMPNKCLMAHMPFLGSSGFDLYVTEGSTYLYKGSFMPPVNREGSYESLINLETREMRDITINFPLYDGVDELYIGLEPDAALEEGGTYRPERPIIYYGSSITQGGCASRPGNCYSNIITRNLNIDHVNLGFSGNAKGEQVMADYIAVQPMSLFFMDYDHNAPSVEHLEKTHEAFYLTIREKNPDLPIIMATKTDTLRVPSYAELTWKRRDIILKTYDNALKRGDKQVRFIDGRTVFDEAGRLGIAADSCAVDGCHPNDLGFACMAKVFGEVIRASLFG